MIPLRLKALVSAGGKLVFEDSDLLREWLLRYASKSIEVVFRAPKKDKTGPQLGYLFGHVVPQIAEYTGYSEEEVYGVLKYQFLRKQIDYREGEPLFSIKSLADCTREEVSKFIQQCVEWGIQLGAEIFPPEYYGGKLC